MRGGNDKRVRKPHFTGGFVPNGLGKARHIESGGCEGRIAMVFRILAPTFALVMVLLAGDVGRAQNYPSQTVTIVVPAPPGGGTDYFARLVAKALTAKWGTNVIVENRAGGGTLIGASAVAKAKPDGYTLLMMPSGTMLNAVLYKQMPINFAHDLTPVAFLADTPFALVVNPSLPVKTVPEFIAYAKARPGELSYASAGPGSLHHLMTEVFQSMTGVKMVQVPFGGSAPALTAVIAGHVPLMFVDTPPALPNIKDGKIRALAVTTAKRIVDAPDLPTMVESGVPDFVVVSWQAVMVTGGTPAAIVAKLNKDIHEAFADPAITSQIAKLGFTPRAPSGVEADRAFMQSELDKWSKVLSKIGLAGTK